MARDWTAIVSQIEGFYPSALGGTSRDEALRLQLVQWLNSLMDHLEKEQRWALSYVKDTIAVASPVPVYALPSGQLVQEYVYRLDSTGQQITLEKYAASELRRVYGEGPLSAMGQPTRYAIQGGNIQFFPVPDANYTIFVEGYQHLSPIVETSGTTTAGIAILTVPSTVYLEKQGVLSAGSGLSVRGAGNLGVASLADTLVTDWTSFPSATTVAMTDVAVTAVPALGAQVFFNSKNWLIDLFDDVVLYGVLRQVASYLRAFEDFQMWEARHQAELEKMREFEFDKSRTLEVYASAHAGQRQSQLRRQDQLIGLDIRGI